VAKRNPFAAIAHGHSLAEAIVDSIREPLPAFNLIAACERFINGSLCRAKTPNLTRRCQNVCEAREET
jgi:hypothetical protein